MIFNNYQTTLIKKPLLEMTVTIGSKSEISKIERDVCDIFKGFTKYDANILKKINRLDNTEKKAVLKLTKALFNKTIHCGWEFNAFNSLSQLLLDCHEITKEDVKRSYKEWHQQRFIIRKMSNTTLIGIGKIPLVFSSQGLPNQLKWINNKLVWTHNPE